MDPQPTSGITTDATAGTLAPGTYYYEVTAATAYGESEPSIPLSIVVGTTGEVTVSWPDATNGSGAAGNGPTLATLESEFSGGTGFWGYNIYRSTSSAGPFGLVGQVPENGSQPTYSFTDTGTTAPGDEPSSNDSFPTATDPGIDCSSATGSWFPVSSGAATPSADSSIDAEIGLDDAFAANNGLTNFTPSAIVTGEHSGLESPNIGAAFADMGITTFAADGSRQPASYTINGIDSSVTPALSTTANSAPRYPSNIYYNAPTWVDEINEYNTLYASTGTTIAAGETGHCAGNTSSTTCITTPATEASILASESHIELTHMLDNNPRVGYAHQTNLIGAGTTDAGSPSGTDSTLLDLLSDILGQYNSWYTAAAPFVVTTDAAQPNSTSQSTVIAEQAAWAKAQAAGTVSATESGGQITVTNNGTSPVTVPITAPSGSTVNGTAFGTPYGGTLSGWESLASGATLAISLPPGSLSGTVTDADTTQPANDICIYLYASGANDSSYATCTAANGTYSFTAVAPGTYDVAFTDPSGLYDTQWYDNESSQSAEDTAGQQVVVMSGSSVTGINAAMAAQVSLAGRVTDAATGQPLTDVCVYAYAADNFNNDVGATCTGASGAYRLGGLPSGSYDVAFVDTSGAHPTAWYDGVIPPGSTGAVTVTNSGPAPEVNEAMPGFTGLGGTVTDADTSMPVANICVYLFDTSGTYAGYGACTAANGTYSFTDVAPGTYDVAFTDPSGLFDTQWYDNESSQSAENGAGQQVVVTAGSTTAAIDAAMYADVSLAGRVTDAATGQPLTDVCVYAYAADNFNNDVGATCTGASGAYRLGGLPSGSYDVAFVDTSGAHPTAWYDGVIPPGSTGAVTVTNSGPAPEVNEAMPGFTGLSGTVTAAASATPLANICVYLFDTSGAYAGYGACTAADGTYSLVGVLPGTYDVAFYDPAAAYATQWFNAQTTQGEATPLTITSGTVSGNVSAAMASAP